MFPERFVKVTTVGGLKHEELFGVPIAAANTSNTVIEIVVSSRQPKLSVTVNEILPIPCSSNKKEPGFKSELLPGVAGDEAFDAIHA